MCDEGRSVEYTSTAGTCNLVGEICHAVVVPLLVRGKINSVTSTLLKVYCEVGREAPMAGDDTRRT